MSGGGDEHRQLPRTRSPLPRSMRTHLRTLLGPDLRAVADAAPDGSATRALAAALDRGAVDVAYQPIVTLSDARPVAVEALLRPPTDVHPDIGDPARTIALAEAAGLIGATGAYVLAHACTDLVGFRRRDSYGELQVHVNVSPLQLRDERLAPLVEFVLDAASLPASALVLEITESAAYEQDGVAEAMLARLTALGVGIAIDDFGTGFASLERLAATPAHAIKLDRSFVGDVGAPDGTARGRALVAQAAIGLGRSLGLRTVAEGIESRSQARTLESWGCEFGQGYLFGRPMRDPQLPAVVSAPRPTARAGRALSTEAIELALSTAVVVLHTATGETARRSAAQELAALLADHAALDRSRTDLAVVLAVVASGRELLEHATDRTTTELRRALDTAPAVGPDATPAALAMTAIGLAAQRADGASAAAALRAVLGATATVDDDLATRLDTWWSTPPPEVLPLDLLRGPERRLRDRDQAGRRLRSLTTLAQAIGTPGSLEDILEVTAEEARVALGAASLSISRFERDRARVRTLVNVGELASWEERRPSDEVYPLADYGIASRLLLEGVVHIEAIGSPSTDANERELLERIGKGSSAVVPIPLDGEVWGEVYATTAVDEPPFTNADIPFLGAVANVVALAVRRTGQVDELARLASEDPLTRLPNRRSLQRWLDEVADAGSTPVSLLLLDVQGLGDLNDEHGHSAGDRVLVRIADALTRATIASGDALAARVAGDEFCVGLRGPATQAIDLFHAVGDRLRTGPPPRPQLVGGIACYEDGPLASVELLQRADAAQARAASLGVALLAVDADGTEVHRSGPTPERAPVATRGRDAGDSLRSGLERWVELLGAGSLSARLEALGELVVPLLDLNRFVVSEAPPGASLLHVRSVHSRRRRPNPIPFAALDEEVYELDDYPLTRAVLEAAGAFVVHVDDPEADAQERALLEEFGHRYVLGVADRSQDGARWLLELYGDAQSASLDVAIPLVEAVAARTLGREVCCRR